MEMAPLGAVDMNVNEARPQIVIRKRKGPVSAYRGDRTHFGQAAVAKADGPAAFNAIRKDDGPGDDNGAYVRAFATAASTSPSCGRRLVSFLS